MVMGATAGPLAIPFGTTGRRSMGMGRGLGALAVAPLVFARGVVGGVVL
jgi:hypothetical protein